jgi:D-tyrosyl-tRNA(Tyr) deacylase
VRVDDEVVGSIDGGLVILLGVGPDDTEAVADELARKVAELRIFRDDEGRTNRSLLEVGGGALVVSQFTLYATRRGRRPGSRPPPRRTGPSACTAGSLTRCGRSGPTSPRAGSAPRWRSSSRSVRPRSGSTADW